MNNSRSIKNICLLILNYFENNELIKVIDDSDFMHFITNKDYFKKYKLHCNFDSFDIFLFKNKDNKFLLSVFDSKVDNNSYISKINNFYKICYKLFIDVSLYKYSVKDDIFSYHFLIEFDKTKIMSVFLDKQPLCDEELVLFSIDDVLMKENESLKII